MLRTVFLIATVLVTGGLCTQPAAAIPVFAHRYGFSCQTCHTEVPHLTAFGEAFRARGYRLPGLVPRRAFPVAVRTQLAYASDALPKAIVDEIEVLAGGAAGPRTSYWAEAYLIDGGQPGRVRDLWLDRRLRAEGARRPLDLRVGQFTLDLPLDPEAFRETTDHYAIWDQRAGANPFAFFDPKIGVQLTAGDPARGIAASLAALRGHDPQSGLPASGTDTMLGLRRAFGPFTLGAYRYDGVRALDGRAPNDRFWRNGFAAGWDGPKTRLDAVYQIGNDTAAGGGALVSSGAFVQLRREIGSRAFAIARWDATQDTAFVRTVTAGAGLRLTRNTRLTVFQTWKRDAAARAHSVLSSSFLSAF